MKAAGPLSLALVLTGTLASAEAPAASSLSARISAEIRTGLPAYAPPPARPKDTPGEVATPDADVLQLPKLTVREKVPPRIVPNDLMTPRALNRKFALDYKKSLKGLDAVLNGFSIPLFGPSLAARGRAQYTARRYQDLSFVMHAAEGEEPAVTNGLQKAEAEMQQAIERQNRPAGGPAYAK
jgi:hypothetical protein